MEGSDIPTIDLSPLLEEGGDENGKKKEISELIGKACSEYGFFQIVNHGVSTELMAKALELSKTFFQYPDEEKLKSSPVSGAPLPAGYNKQPDNSPDKKEYLLLFPPGSSFDVCPENPPELRDVMEEVFSSLVKIGSLLETILNDCLGLPPNFLKEFNDDRSWDFMAAVHYFAATETEKNGITEHEDGNILTFVLQDEVGGLEVRKNGKWIPVVPAKGTLVVNVGDLIQVLSNKKFRSATHRVVLSERNRYSYVFFYNLHGEKWVEPLPQFTKDIGEPPKYRGFLYKEYQELRMRNKSHPPSKPEDVIHITHYAINT